MLSCIYLNIIWPADTHKYFKKIDIIFILLNSITVEDFLQVNNIRKIPLASHPYFKR